MLDWRVLTVLRLTCAWFHVRLSLAVLNIMVDFSGYESASTTISVQHYGILEGGALTMYLVVQSIVMLNVAVRVTECMHSVADGGACSSIMSCGPGGRMRQSCASCL